MLYISNIIVMIYITLKQLSSEIYKKLVKRLVFHYKAWNVNILGVVTGLFRKY